MFELQSRHLSSIAGLVNHVCQELVTHQVLLDAGGIPTLALLAIEYSVG